MCGGTVCMQSSNVMEDISCRTADLEELIYPRQTEIKLFVRKDIIDILRGSEHIKPTLSLSWLRSGIGSRDIQMNQYIACFSFLKLISLCLSPPFFGRHSPQRHFFLRRRRALKFSRVCISSRSRILKK